MVSKILDSMHISEQIPLKELYLEASAEYSEPTIKSRFVCRHRMAIHINMYAISLSMVWMVWTAIDCDSTGG